MYDHIANLTDIIPGKSMSECDCGKIAFIYYYSEVNAEMCESCWDNYELD